MQLERGERGKNHNFELGETKLQVFAAVKDDIEKECQSIELANKGWAYGLLISVKTSGIDFLSCSGEDWKGWLYELINTADG